MSQPEQSFEPRELFAAGVAAKMERRRFLAGVFAPPPPETDEGNAADELADLVADRVIAALREP